MYVAKILNYIEVILVSDEPYYPKNLVMFDSVSNATPLVTSGTSSVCKFISGRGRAGGGGPWVTQDPAMMSPPRALLLPSPSRMLPGGQAVFHAGDRLGRYLVTRAASCPPRGRLEPGPASLNSLMFYAAVGVLNRIRPAAFTARGLGFDSWSLTRQPVQLYS